MTEKLLHVLRHRANHRGQVIAQGPRLQEELGCSLSVLEAAVTELVSSGRVEIVSPLPWLIAKVRTTERAVATRRLSWSGSDAPEAQSEQQISSESSSVHREVPVSGAAAAALQQREDGGAGEGEALLDHVIAALGPDADREEFRSILVGHPTTLIHRCLRRVQATKSIRVSRAALFRSLLAKLSH